MMSPSNVKEIRQFLGVTNQLAKFSPNLADFTNPLHTLLCKINSWKWSDVDQNAYDLLKFSYRLCQF